PHLDLDSSLGQRQHDEDTVVLALLANTASVVFKEFVRVFADVTEWLERWHRGDDNDVAGGGFQRPNHAIDLCRGRGIDHSCEVVDWLHQLGQSRSFALERGDRDGLARADHSGRLDGSPQTRQHDRERQDDQNVRPPPLNRVRATRGLHGVADHPSTYFTRRSAALRYVGKIRAASADEMSVTCASLTTSVTTPGGSCSARSTCRAAADGSCVSEPCSRARLASRAANGAADCTMSSASASLRQRVSRKPSRRCSK